MWGIRKERERGVEVVRSKKGWERGLEGVGSKEREWGARRGSGWEYRETGWDGIGGGIERGVSRDYRLEGGCRKRGDGMGKG